LWSLLALVLAFGLELPYDLKCYSSAALGFCCA